MANDVPGGPGWVIRGDDLRPAITDLEAFRAGMRDDPLAGAVELLWSGRPAEADVLLAQQDPSVRVRALRADCRRDRGDAAGAVHDYDALVRECTGTAWEAVMRQHRGKALLATGAAQAALVEFERALALRTAAGAGDDLLASSRQAVDVARETVARQTAARSAIDAGLPGGDRTTAAS
ncbi:hypothetical protein [Georgenia faecalis]|uniref:hypothetical protein n=1 Tax=Georgenia faecalis TaxID=2483799 RepID=UPI000FDC49B5|nr:hypothetical protein [Georgenia faecalis]